MMMIGVMSEQIVCSDSCPVWIGGPVGPGQLKELIICEGLDNFRLPHSQYLALIDIAGLPEGLVFIACDKNNLIGYVTFHYPEFERWARSGMPCLLELGAVEVSRLWRGKGISSNMIKLAAESGLLEEKITISVECHWSWDLQGSNTDSWEYRCLMERLLAKGGFITGNTDDPDVTCHPMNIFSVRIGSKVSSGNSEQFKKLCFQKNTS